MLSTVKGLRFYKLACHSFMNVDRGHKIVITAITPEYHYFCTGSLPQPQCQCEWFPDGYLLIQQVAFQERNYDLRKPKCFIIVSKHAFHLLVGDIIILDSKFQVSQGCHNKLPRFGQLKTTVFVELPSFRSAGYKYESGYWQGHLPSETCRGIFPSLPSLWWFNGKLWCSLTYSCITLVSAYAITQHSL